MNILQLPKTASYYVSNSLAGCGSWNIYVQLNRVTAHSYKTYTLEWFSLNCEFSSDRFLIYSSLSNFLEDLRVTTCFHEFFVATRKSFKISLLFSSNNELLLLALWSELKKKIQWKLKSWVWRFISVPIYTEILDFHLFIHSFINK